MASTKAHIKPDDFAAIEKYCADTRMSKAAFIVAATRYCIDHGIYF